MSTKPQPWGFGEKQTPQSLFTGIVPQQCWSRKDFTDVALDFWRSGKQREEIKLKDMEQFCLCRPSITRTVSGGTGLAVWWLRLTLAMQGPWSSTLVREVRSHMQCSAAKEKKAH